MADNVNILGEWEALAQLISGDFSETNGHFESDDAISYLVDSAFYNTKSDANINLKSIKLNVVSMGNFAFRSSRLERIYLPNLRQPSSYCFDGSTNLTLIDLRSLITLGDHHLNACSSLTTIVLNSSVLTTLSNLNALTSTKYATTGSGGAYVYVPRDLIASYQAATNWATLYAAHADMFRALEDYTVDGTTTGEFDETKL